MNSIEGHSSRAPMSQQVVSVRHKTEKLAINNTGNIFDDHQSDDSF